MNKWQQPGYFVSFLRRVIHHGFGFHIINAQASESVDETQLVDITRRVADDGHVEWNRPPFFQLSFQLLPSLLSRFHRSSLHFSYFCMIDETVI